MREINLFKFKQNNNLGYAVRPNAMALWPTMGVAADRLDYGTQIHTNNRNTHQSRVSPIFTIHHNLCALSLSRCRWLPIYCGDMATITQSGLTYVTMCMMVACISIAPQLDVTFITFHFFFLSFSFSLLLLCSCVLISEVD